MASLLLAFPLISLAVLLLSILFPVAVLVLLSGIKRELKLLNADYYTAEQNELHAKLNVNTDAWK